MSFVVLTVDQIVVSYLFPFPTLSSNLAFRLATLIFAKTRFCSHINFIGRCLNSKVIPKGFRSNFHASTFSHSNQYLHQIRCAQNSFSRHIMRIKIRAMCQKRNVLDKQILQCRSALSKICPVVLLQSIRAKIRELNSGLFDHLLKTDSKTPTTRPSARVHWVACGTCSVPGNFFQVGGSLRLF